MLKPVLSRAFGRVNIPTPARLPNTKNAADKTPSPEALRSFTGIYFTKNILIALKNVEIIVMVRTLIFVNFLRLFYLLISDQSAKEK